MIPNAGWRPAALALVLVLVTLVALLRPVAPLSVEEPAGPVKITLPDLPLQRGRLAADWVPTGGPYEQVIYALALGPSPEVLYTGTWGEGLYRSDDGGRTWEADSRSDDGTEGEDLTNTHVRALAVTPDGDTIYLSDWGKGVWRSRDRGATWEATGLLLPFHDDWNADVVLIDQDDPDVVYQATWGGVYRSVDSGDSWELKDVDPDQKIPWEQKRVYALVQARDGTLYAGTFGSGVYRSRDGGDAWEAIGPERSASARQVFSLATRDGVVWAGTQDGVYRTADGREGWQPVSSGFADDPRTRTVQVLTLDDAGSLYAGTVDFGIYRSDDGGDTWQSYSDRWSIISLVYDARVSTLYAGTAGSGIYRNDGAGWEPINKGLPSPAYEVQSLAFVGSEQETLLVSTFGGGVYASDDRGQSWQRWSRALPVGLARNVPDMVTLNDGQIILVAGGTGLRRSVDYGQRWDWVRNGLPTGDHRVLSLVQGQRNPALLFAALEQERHVGIYRSTDGGETWEYRGQLDRVDDLALGADGQMLFAVQLGRGLFRSDDQGINWRLLGSGIIPHSLQIATDERNSWQRLVLGLPRQTLHVQALDGIYSSFDGGEGWRPSLRGQINTILIDPERAGVLYAAAMTDTVSSEVVAELGGEPQYPFWVSLDDGRSWGQASASDRPLTVLALDPKNRNRLLAGTSDSGIYYTTVALPSLYTTGRALLGLAVFVALPALLFGLLLGLYLYFLLGLRLRLYPWQVWALIFRFPTWRLVSTPHSELGSLEQLIASVATDLEAPFTAEALWEELQSLGVAPSLTQVQNVLSSLQARRLFTRNRGGGYCFALVALARLAALNFDREALIETVRSANRILRSAEAFFDQAGFQVVPLLDRLFLWPESPHYRALGWLNAWLHIHRPLDESAVTELADSTDIGSRDLGFVVLDHTPTPGAYRAMQAARLIPLGSSEMQKAVDQREAGLVLERAIRQGRGQDDVFDLREPLLDHLSLFGRADLLDSWLAAVEQDREVYFWGLPRSGRTSALWWLRTKVPGRWLRSYVDLRFRGPGWLPILRDLLADLLLNLRYTHSRLAALPEVDDVLAACGSALDLGAGLDYLAEQGLPALSPRFVFFLDGVTPGAVPGQIQELAAQRDDVSLVVSWDGLPSNPATLNGGQWLLPLTPTESQSLLATVGARLGLDFDGDDLSALERAAGGHPFLLRQLGSQIARMAGRPDEASTGPVLRPGEWPEPPVPKHFPAEAAIEAYLQRQPRALVRFWHALSPEVRRNVRLLAAGQLPDPELEPAYTALGLLARDDSGAPRLRIGLLSRWLQEGRS